MNITVFGATGGTGACLLREALAAGHRVTAVVRDPARLAGQSTTARPRLEVITADVMDPAAIGPAVAGADAVLSAIGPHGSGAPTVSHDPPAAIIAAMHAAGARRLIVVSGSVVTDVGDDPFLRLVKPLVRRTQLRHVCADMPPPGTSRPAIDRNLPREYTISRTDLARCILGLVGNRDSVHKHVAIAS